MWRARAAGVERRRGGQDGRRALEGVDHIEAIRELDLEGVEPTSHVIDVVNALRADVPEPSLDRDVALAPAPEPTAAGFGVPSPGASAE